MKKIDPAEYGNYIRYIDGKSGGAVYPLSIAENIQKGEVFAGSRAVLFWHYCGFAFIYGEYDEELLCSVHDIFFGGSIPDKRRFILFTADDNIRVFFEDRGKALIERRYFFEYPEREYTGSKSESLCPCICELDGELLDKTEGNITPFFSWDSREEFLKKGKGYCIADEGYPEAWAFTAAVCSKEIDIGVETRCGYRRSGYGAAAAGKMVEYCLEQGKRPVWACHSENAASGRLAVKLGFVKSSECFTVKRHNN